MPYVLSSGEISDKQPWGLAKITAFFWGIINFFFMFFRTLISPGTHSRGDRYTQDFRPGGGVEPHHITSQRDLAERLREAGSKLVVIDFHAKWCGPCKMIAPYIDQMAAQMPDVMFLKVDVDECDSIAATYSVSSMPTFIFLKNGRTVDSFAGANVGKLQQCVGRYR